MLNKEPIDCFFTITRTKVNKPSDVFVKITKAKRFSWTYDDSSYGKRIEVKDLLKDDTKIKEIIIFCGTKDILSITQISDWFKNLGYSYMEKNQLNDIRTLYTHIEVNIQKEYFLYRPTLHNPRRNDRGINYDYILSDDMISYIKLIDF